MFSMYREKIVPLDFWLSEQSKTFNMEKVNLLMEILYEHNEQNRLEGLIFIPFKQEHISPIYSELRNWSKEKAYASIPAAFNYLDKTSISAVKQYETEYGLFFQTYLHDWAGKVRYLCCIEIIQELIKKNENGLFLELERIKKNIPYDVFKNYMTKQSIQRNQSVFLHDTDEEKLGRAVIMNSGDSECIEIKKEMIDKLDGLPFNLIQIGEIRNGGSITIDGWPTKEQIFAYTGGKEPKSYLND